MLAPTSFAMDSKETKEECSEELNERMHTHIGYHEKEWNKRSVSNLQIAIDEVEKFQVISDLNFMSMRWEQRILEFIRVAFELPMVSLLHRGSVCGFRVYACCAIIGIFVACFN